MNHAHLGLREGAPRGVLGVPLGGTAPLMLPCEVAQATLFAAELQAEITELQARIEAAEHRWQQRRLRCPAEVDQPERLVRLRAQLDEATQLLDGLKFVSRRRRPRQSQDEH